MLRHAGRGAEFIAPVACRDIHQPSEAGVARIDGQPARHAQAEVRRQMAENGGGGNHIRIAGKPRRDGAADPAGRRAVAGQFQVPFPADAPLDLACILKTAAVLMGDDRRERGAVARHRQPRRCHARDADMLDFAHINFRQRRTDRIVNS